MVNFKFSGQLEGVLLMALETKKVVFVNSKEQKNLDTLKTFPTEVRCCLAHAIFLASQGTVHPKSQLEKEDKQERIYKTTCVFKDDFYTLGYGETESIVYIFVVLVRYKYPENSQNREIISYAKDDKKTLLQFPEKVRCCFAFGLFVISMGKIPIGAKKMDTTDPEDLIILVTPERDENFNVANIYILACYQHGGKMTVQNPQIGKERED